MGERGAVEALLAEHGYHTNQPGREAKCQCGAPLVAKYGQVAAAHRAHLADLLDRHVREAEARVLREAADECQERIVHVLDAAVDSGGFETGMDVGMEIAYTEATKRLRERAARVVRGGES